MKNNILKTASVMIVLNLCSKGLGFIRDYLTAIKFGTSMDADAYLMALNIPNILFVIIGTAITTILVPIYNDIKQNKSEKDLKDFISNIITILIIISFIITIFSEVFAPKLVNIMAPGFEGSKYALTVLLTRILSSVIVLNTLVYIFTTILQCENSFKLPAAIGIPYNLVLILYFIFFIEKFGVIGMSIMVSIALSIQIIILYIGLRKINFKYKLILNLKDKSLKKMLSMFIPVFIGTGMHQLNGIFNNMFASTLDGGSVAAINYALKLNMLISDIVIISITTVIYQNICKAYSNGSNVSAESNKGIIIMFILLIPIITIASFYCEYIVKFLFERGAFTSESTYMTSQAFYYYSFGLFAVAINNILSRICYSQGNTKTPMVNTFFSIIINITLSLILKKYLGIGGIALASTIGNFVSIALLYNNIRKSAPNCISKDTVVVIGKLVISNIPLIILIIFSKQYILNINSINIFIEMIKMLIIIIIGVALYFLFAINIKVNEIKQLTDEYIKVLVKRR